jgi:hypothetical protein
MFHLSKSQPLGIHVRLLLRTAWTHAMTGPTPRHAQLYPCPLPFGSER